MRLRLELDAETGRQLIEVAVRRRRPVQWQAEVLLQRAVRREVRRQSKERGVWHAKEKQAEAVRHG